MAQRTHIYVLLMLVVPGLFGAASYSAQGSASATGMPASDAGIWQVVNVRVDTASTGTLQYQADDPRLVGRLVTIKPEVISSNIRSTTGCERPSIEQTRMTVGTLIKDTMAHRWMKPVVPTPRDFEWSIPEQADIDVLWVKCARGNIGPTAFSGPSIGMNWIARAGDQLLIRWFDNSLLVLQRVSSETAPRASFDCRKAGLAAERTICGSLGLAAYDRSVATAYADIVSQYKELGETAALKRLQAEQKAWLVQRNQCGGDAACLQKSMQDRLEVLSQPQESHELQSGPTQERHGGNPPR